MIKKLLEKILSSKKENKPKDYEWERFQRVAKEQFLRLQEKGIGIPIVTL